MNPIAQAMTDLARMLIAGFGVVFVLYAIYGLVRIWDRCRAQREILPPPVQDSRDTTGQFKRIFWQP